MKNSIFEKAIANYVNDRTINFLNMVIESCSGIKEKHLRAGEMMYHALF